MKKKMAALLLCGILAGTSSVYAGAEEPTKEFAGETLSILVSAGWMQDRYDATLERFEETYDVTVDLQTIPADQYLELLQSKLLTDSCTDVFWIQSNPFGIESSIINPEEYCIDFTGAEWAPKIPEGRLSSCTYNGKLLGTQVWPGSPEWIMLYNKTLFEENGWEVPTTYEELKTLCGEIKETGITPWYLPGADGISQQLLFFQIGGAYEKAEPGLYEKLNTNQVTFAGNEKMIQVLEQFKELSDLGYFGEDWIGTDSTDMNNVFANRECAMIIACSGNIKQIQEEYGMTDEIGMFLEPLGDNDTYPYNPAGPTMFGYKKSEHPELVKEFFDFIMTTESLQEILDNSSGYTNLDVIDENLEQHWLPEEEEFLASITEEQKAVPVLQTGTKYTNDFWMQFGQDMIAYCQGTIEDPNEILINLDNNRAELAKTFEDENWK